MIIHTIIPEENSCYIDSLIYYFSKSKYKNLLLESQILKTIPKYLIPNHISTSRFNSIWVCIKQYLIMELNNPKSTNSLRNVLSEILPLKENNKYVFFPIDYLYSTFSDMFVKLNIEYNINHINIYGKCISNTKTNSSSMFHFHEYMSNDNPFNKYGVKQVIDWDICNSDILTFANGNLNIKNYFDISDEGNFKKDRVFNEYIIDNRYELTGVILLTGLVENQFDSGNHYLLLFKSNGRWNYFNNLERFIHDLGCNIPDDAKKFNTDKCIAPVMYFYEKIKDNEKCKEIIDVELFYEEEKNIIILIVQKSYNYNHIINLINTKNIEYDFSGSIITIKILYDDNNIFNEDLKKVINCIK